MQGIAVGGEDAAADEKDPQVQEYEQGDLARWRGLLMTGVFVTLLSGAAISAAGLALIWALPHLIADAYLMPLWLCLFCVPLFALSEINEGISRAHGWITPPWCRPIS